MRRFLADRVSSYLKDEVIMNRKLASAYADAVLDYLETGARQGIVYEDGLFVCRDDTELSVAAEPIMWVGDNWNQLVAVSAPTDAADPEYSKLRIRAQIIEVPVDSDFIRGVAAKFGDLTPLDPIPVGTPPVSASQTGSSAA